MTTITAAVGGGNWSVGGTWVGGVAPTAADDAVLAVTSGNVTINGTSGSPNLCRSLTCTGYTGTLTAGSGATLNVGDGTTGAFLLVAGMTFAPNAASVINFVSTTTGNNVTCAGKTLGIVNFTGIGGAWTYQDTFAAAGLKTLNNGTVNDNGKTVNLLAFASNNSNTRALTATGTWSLSQGGGTVWDITTSTGMTLTATSSTMGFTGQTNTFQGGGLSYGVVNFNVAGTTTITGTNSFVTLTKNPTASKSSVLAFAADQTITNFTVNGNSVVNRVQICSSLGLTIQAGARRTLTVTTNSLTNINIMDIAGAGGANWNLSAITGLCGDGSNNSGITTTTPIDAYMVTAVSANWSGGIWFSASGGVSAVRVPLPQDTARIDSNSVTTSGKTITMDMPNMGPILITNVANTPVIAYGSLTVFQCGSLTLASGITMTGSGLWNIFCNSVSTLTTAGIGFPGVTGTFRTSGSSSLTLQDKMTAPSTVSHLAGAFTISAAGMQCTTFTSSTTSTRTLNLGSGTITLTGTGTVWNTSTATGLTLNPSTSTIDITDTSATTSTFSGGGLTFAKLRKRGAASSGTMTIAASNTFSTMTFDPDSNIKFTNGTTTTLTQPPVWWGTSGHNVIIDSVTTSAFTVSMPAGYVASCDYITLGHSTATGGATWYAGSHSTNSGGNTNWIFTAATFTDSISESTTATDSVSPATTFNTATSDSAAASDAVSVSATFNATTSDSAAASDTAEVVATFSASISDSAAAADSVAVAVDFNASIIESVAAIDAVSVTAIFNAATSDSATATDMVRGTIVSVPDIRVYGIILDKKVIPVKI